MNALGIVYRELDGTTGRGRHGAARARARTIRAGDVPPGTLQRVKADVEARLRIASPQFLEQYRAV